MKTLLTRLCALFLASATTALAEVPPQEAYQLHCSGCHGPDGTGLEGTIPSLREMASLLALPGGREYLARVPGVAQAPLESRKLAELMNWVLREISDGTDFVPYEADELESWRERPLRDPLALRPSTDEEPSPEQ